LRNPGGAFCDPLSYANSGGFRRYSVAISEHWNTEHRGRGTASVIGIIGEIGVRGAGQ
jgi:hypothetical protein